VLPTARIVKPSAKRLKQAKPQAEMYVLCEIWFNLLDVGQMPQLANAVVLLATGETEDLNSAAHAR
jgi:hypothetical protein